MNVPKDINERNALDITAKNVGALQMSKGRIGDFAILISQKAKTKKETMPMTKGAITDADPQPAKGA